MSGGGEFLDTAVSTGTSNYIHQSLMFSVSIALELAGELVLGAVS